MQQGARSGQVLSPAAAHMGILAMQDACTQCSARQQAAEHGTERKT